MTRPTVNLAESIRAKLRNLSKTQERSTAHLLEEYVRERFLFRLGCSPWAQDFALKGASLFRLWSLNHRNTRDIDFWCRGSNDLDAVRAQLLQICQQPVEDDGLIFEPDKMRLGRLHLGQPNQGVRVDMEVGLMSSRVVLRLDPGFGDEPSPAPRWTAYPTLLPMPAPWVCACSAETSVGDKLHALVDLGQTNTRLKDFFDLYYLSQSMEFEGELLLQAIRASFARKATPWPSHIPEGLSDAFGLDPDKQSQWHTFLRRHELKVTFSFQEILAHLRPFLLPALAAAANTAQPWPKRWLKTGPWV